MALFQRFRRTDDPASVPVPRGVMPKVNQRVTVLRAGHPPEPSRVEDEAPDSFVIASPNLALADGERVIVSWESEDGWYSLDSTVASIHEHEAVPTVEIACGGRLVHHDDRRAEVRLEVAVPLLLRPVITRVVKPGHALETRTVELSGKALRFSSSAPFAPGDLVESTIELGGDERVHARIKIIRVDAASDSWRSVCTAVFDEILRSDRSRLIAWLEGAELQGVATAPAAPGRIDTEDLRPD